MLKIIRVLPGNLGLAVSNGQPIFLLPGRHLVVDPLFTFQRQVSMTEAHISISTAHLITVPVGTVGLASVDSTAHFLEAGRHVFNHQRFSFIGFKRATGARAAWSCGDATDLSLHDATAELHVSRRTRGHSRHALPRL